MTTLSLFKYAFQATAVLALFSYLPSYLLNTTPLHEAAAQAIGYNGHATPVWLVVFLSQLVWSKLRKRQESQEARASVYGLQHGRLHLQLPTAMWMNMGYWKIPHGELLTAPKTMAEACRDLLNAVLTEAGLMHDSNATGIPPPTHRSKCIIDIGFGCGDQTIYMMSSNPVRSCDEAWWDNRDQRVQFDHYIGITKDPTQFHFATERVNELISGKTHRSDTKPSTTNSNPQITLFCADAATPDTWTHQIRNTIESAQESSDERWVLALDTAYHFSPSRWPLISHACNNLNASFMAFDLCLSPTATLVQITLLRTLTALMGAPWANFVTPQEYRRRLVEAGYLDDAVRVTDISEHVFAPLSKYMEEQDRRLKAFGLGIGGFKVARWMFDWWGRTGVVRGVIVVAKKVGKE